MSSLLILRVFFVTNTIFLLKIYTGQTVSWWKRRRNSEDEVQVTCLQLHSEDHSESLHQIVTVKFLSKSLL